MRQVASHQLVDFSRIYEDDVELITVRRASDGSLSSQSARLLEAGQVIQARWEQPAGDINAALTGLSGCADPSWQQAMGSEIALAGELLSELLGCDRVGVRVTSLRAPMCPRFHVDQVPCRLLMTITGPGTEWIACDEVDRALLANRTIEAPPLRAGAGIRQLTTTAWSLLKGGTWTDRFGGVVHRSPHSRAPRLLVSMDPITAH
ncbi:MAG: DUF1826 domain-containing protein [Chromatiales bacterium]|nr:DUF1826 domain-containing protein [Chromatiales bacterium]